MPKRDKNGQEYCAQVERHDNRGKREPSDRSGDGGGEVGGTEEKVSRNAEVEA